MAGGCDIRLRQPRRDNIIGRMNAFSHPARRDAPLSRPMTVQTGLARRRAIPALALLALGGCTLIDQDTFAPAPEAPEPKPPAPPPPPGPDAYVTIEYGPNSPDYRRLLRAAINLVEQRNPRTQYDVVVVVPSADRLAEAQRASTETLELLRQERIPSSRTHLGLRIDPSQPVVQVKVYLR